MIKGENIYLRAVEMSDIDILYRIENNDKTWLYGSKRAPYSKDMITDFIKRSIKYDIYTEKQLRLIIMHNMNNIFIGYIDIFDFDTYNKRAAVGVFIQEDYRKKGYASEALDLIINYCFKILSLKQIFCDIEEDNTDSINLFQQKGFCKCALKKDWLYVNGYWKNQITMQLINY